MGGSKIKIIINLACLLSTFCFAQVKVKVIASEIDYSAGYLNDLNNNFLLPPVHSPHEFISNEGGEAKTAGPGTTGDHWLVVYNAHSDQELNVTNVPDSAKRTLKWCTPYEYAVYALGRAGSSHDQSALLRNWTRDKDVRAYGTFLCIPPHSHLRLWSGYAATQKIVVPDEGSGKVIETRGGGGMQWRLYALPAGTICLTTRIVPENSSKGVERERIKISIHDKLLECIAYYNAQSPAGGPSLSKELAEPEKSVHPYDDIDIIRYYEDQAQSMCREFVAAKDRPNPGSP